MREFSVKSKTGFCCVDNKPVRIYESKRSKLFYLHSGNPKGNFYFNLPKGNYFTMNEIKPLKKPVFVSIPKLPKKEKKQSLPDSIKVYYLENPNKASIITSINTIQVDPKILKLSLPSIVFVLFHELGHYFYKDEKKCDLFAAVQMLKRGFNPSQCGIAIDSSLSDLSFERKLCLINKMKNL
jgi:hypothetical protein